MSPALSLARAAQPGWATVPAAARCRIIGVTRRALVRERGQMLAALALVRPVEETLAAEFLPLLDAMRFLERHGARLLAPSRPVGRAPLWLAGVRAEVRREPFGVVLVIAPGNYPLFLAGVQLMQALAAGNTVCVKPPPGLAAPLMLLAGLLHRAGVPEGAVCVLGDTAEVGEAAVQAGFDRIVFTGGAATGARVLAAAASSITPCTMELSGDDPVFILPGADLIMAARCIAYGLRLNRGATCIAPHRVFVPEADAPALEAALLTRLSDSADIPLGRLAAERVAAALEHGARLVAGRPETGPVVLAGDAAAGVTEDVFGPVLSVLPVPDMEAALALAAESPYALGASVFGPEAAALRFAGRVRAGSVVVNDLIVPTADPRLPFGGRGRSGFGVTRGADGLLEMTALKTVSVRQTRFRPQFMSPSPAGTGHPADMDPRLAPDLVENLVLTLHGGPAERLRGIAGLMTRGRSAKGSLRRH